MSLAAWTPPALFAALDGAARWNALMSWAGVALPLAAPKATFAFKRAEPPDATAFALEVAAEPLRFLLAPQQIPFKAMAGVDLEAADLAVLPPSIAAALGQGLVDWVWSALPDNRLGAAEVGECGRLGDMPPPAGRLEWFDAEFAGLAPAPLRFAVGLPAEDLVAALGRERLVARAVQAAWARALPADVDYTLGRVTLPLAQARSLAEGDVLLIDPPPEDVALARALGVRFAFRAGERGWTCIEAADSRGDDMDDAAGSGGIAVTVDFDLARTTMTLAQIETWKPGVVVPLEPPARAEGVEITLRVNGRAVAQGDLVSVDDRLAVMITRLLGAV